MSWSVYGSTGFVLQKNERKKDQIKLKSRLKMTMENLLVRSVLLCPGKQTSPTELSSHTPQCTRSHRAVSCPAVHALSLSQISSNTKSRFCRQISWKQEYSNIDGCL